MRALAGVASLLLAGVSATFAQTSQPLNNVGGHGKSDAIVTQCEEDIRQKLMPVQAQYANELNTLVKTYQPRGELENVIAVKTEQDRFTTAGRIEPADIVTSPEGLRDLQTKYKALMEQIVRQTADQYLTSLEQQKKSLTIEGKLDEALAVKADIEQIQQRDGPVEDNIAQALVGKWLGDTGSHNWQGTYVYSTDGSYEVFDLSGKRVTTGRWIVAGKNKVKATWHGGTDAIEFINPREYRWTNLDGWGGVATKVE